jgi:hypothetical protein
LVACLRGTDAAACVGRGRVWRAGCCGVARRGGLGMRLGLAAGAAQYVRGKHEGRGGAAWCGVVGAAWLVACLRGTDAAACVGRGRVWRACCCGVARRGGLGMRLGLAAGAAQAVRGKHEGRGVAAWCGVVGLRVERRGACAGEWGSAWSVVDRERARQKARQRVKRKRESEAYRDTN